MNKIRIAALLLAAALCFTACAEESVGSVTDSEASTTVSDSNSASQTESKSEETSKDSEPESVPEETSQDSEPESIPEETSLESEPESVPEETSLESEPESVPEETSQESEPESVPEETSQESEPESIPEETSQESEPESIPEETSQESEESTAPLPTAYDKEFFDDALFIGDSITTGLYLYGYLDASKVFAKQSLSPLYVLETVIDGRTVEQAVSEQNPAKIYIMLGTNSTGYVDAGYLANTMGELIEKLKSMTDADIYVLSIPPVTRAAESSANNYLSKAAVNEYNSLLHAVIDNAGVHFIDFNKVLSDKDGYFLLDYAEMDGIHFMGYTYNVMLSVCQSGTVTE